MVEDFDDVGNVQKVAEPTLLITNHKTPTAESTP